MALANRTRQNQHSTQKPTRSGHCTEVRCTNYSAMQGEALLVANIYLFSKICLFCAVLCCGRTERSIFVVLQ
ncbi:hypothetical protein GOODEAATRI_023730 [Goodea atripinnis]|uniref:Uncharacterized protein n=1 Tax=Goodea atripinnis TaxID=208336 RepID=A0ABV0NYG8_9TELE